MYGGLLVVLPASIPILAALKIPAGLIGDIAIFTMLIHHDRRTHWLRDERLLCGTAVTIVDRDKSS